MCGLLELRSATSPRQISTGTSTAETANHTAIVHEHRTDQPADTGFMGAGADHISPPLQRKRIGK